MSIVSEFKEFALKGNVMDLAVGVIIGGAFGKIISSVVTDVIMPPIGLIMGGVNFTELKLVLKAASVAANGKEIPAVAINYGSFIQASVDFLIVALSVFLMVKAINSLQKKPQVVDSPAPPPTEQVLLTEIRDLLKTR